MGLGKWGACGITMDGGAKVGMGRSGSRKCTDSHDAAQVAAHMKGARTCDLSPKLSPEPELNKGDVDDTGT